MPFQTAAPPESDQVRRGYYIVEPFLEKIDFEYKCFLSIKPNGPNLEYAMRMNPSQDMRENQHWVNAPDWMMGELKKFLHTYKSMVFGNVEDGFPGFSWGPRLMSDKMKSMMLRVDVFSIGEDKRNPNNVDLRVNEVSYWPIAYDFISEIDKKDVEQVEELAEMMKNFFVGVYGDTKKGKRVAYPMWGDESMRE